MIETITKKTQEFLQACKEAGYERVTIFVHDKRVPDSCMIRKGSTGWDADEEGMSLHPGEYAPRFTPKYTEGCTGSYWGIAPNGAPFTPHFKVVCGTPEQRGPHPTLPGNKWPKMWGIVRRLKLNARGGGNRDGHDIQTPSLLTAGYYDLAELV